MPRRLSRLRELGSGVRVADGPLARLLGLAGLRTPPPGTALLLRRCSCVHTFGMRFTLDVVFLDAQGTVLREVRGIPPCRVVRCPGAYAVLERPTAQAEPTSAANR